MLFFFSICGRIDNIQEERPWEIIIGLAFAISMFLINIRRTNRTSLIWFFVTWILFSGTVFALHELQWFIRTAGNGRMIASNQVKAAYLGLLDYKKDCGSYPSQKSGLAALRRNSGVRGWAGPYMESADDLTDP